MQGFAATKCDTNQSSLGGGASYGEADKNFRVRGSAIIKNGDENTEGFWRPPIYVLEADMPDYLHSSFPLPRESLGEVINKLPETQPETQQQKIALKNLINSLPFKDAWKTTANTITFNRKGLFGGAGAANNADLLDPEKTHMWSVKCLVDVGAL